MSIWEIGSREIVVHLLYQGNCFQQIYAMNWTRTKDARTKVQGITH